MHGFDVIASRSRHSRRGHHNQRLLRIFASDLVADLQGQIRSENPEQPLIMMIEPGVSAPARDYVEPIEPEALLKRVKAIFTAAQAGKALAA